MMKYFTQDDQRGYFGVIIIIILILYYCLKLQFEDENGGIMAAIYGGPWIIDETKCSGQHHATNRNWLNEDDEVYLDPLRVFRGGDEQELFNSFTYVKGQGSKKWYTFSERADGSDDTHHHCVLFWVRGPKLDVYAQQRGATDECGPHPSNQYPTQQHINNINQSVCDAPHEGGWQGSY